MDQTGNDVSILNAKVVMRSVDVGRDDGCEVTSVLLGVGSVHGVNESFGVGIALVTGMGWAVVEHGLVDGVFGFVGEDACGEHGDEFGDLVEAAVFHDVVVDESVFTVEFNLLCVMSCEMCVRIEW